jgi:putative protease
MVTGGNKLPKLLVPAGVYPSNVKAAVENGADAIYVGVTRLNQSERLKSHLGYRGEISCFTVDRIREILAYCAANSVELQVALNNQYADRQREEAMLTLQELVGAGVSSVVIADPVFMKWISENYPGVRISASVVGGTTNRLTAKYYQSLGATKVTLENCLPFPALKKLRAATDLALGVFVYGVTCLACHGTCQLSAYLTGVTCVAPCNRKVSLEVNDGTLSGRYLRSRDLDLLSALPRLAELGIDEVKIEGRMRPPRFVAATTAAARHVLDAIKDGRDPALPPRLSRRLRRLPFFGTTTGYHGSAAPEKESIAVEGGSLLNKVLEYTLVPSPRLTSYLVRRRLLGPMGKPWLVPAASPGAGQGDEPRRQTLPRPQIIVETALIAPVIPAGADRISIGEKHCARRLLHNAGALPHWLAKIRQTGAAPWLTLPARVTEDVLDDVVELALSVRDRIGGATCHDYGLAARLAGEMPVTVVAPLLAASGVDFLVSSTGATAARPLRTPLLHYLRNGFPKCDVEIQVFGHIPLMDEIYCLTRKLGPCPGCANGWWKVTRDDIELRLDGNAVYSGRAISAHEMRERLRQLPFTAFVVEAIGQPPPRVEAVIRFYRGEAEWPGLPLASLCNAPYFWDPDDPVHRQFPWNRYLPDPWSFISTSANI